MNQNTILFLRNTGNERADAHAQMELDVIDFNKDGGAGETFGESNGCRPIGSSSPNASWYYTEWGPNFTRANGRIQRWEEQMRFAGLSGPTQFEVYDSGETLAEALFDMGLERLPPSPVDLGP